jgi:tRNA (mo5U34)-methyltransferase
VNYQALYDYLASQQQSSLGEYLRQLIQTRLDDDSHGTLSAWKKALANLPELSASVIELASSVTIGNAADLKSHDKNQFIDTLMQFHPWRKGPYSLFGIDLDTEWRSDWKWQRVLPHISPLQGRKVLDVGGGNGYHGWRMIGAGAEFVLGIDPTILFVMQYQVMQKFTGLTNHFVVPCGLEQLPTNIHFFDTVFSMGVLYHRRSPIDHLLELRNTLKPGGELVLETLIIEGELGQVLMPESRYAKMRNVWFLPSSDTMLLWLKRSGFKDIRCVDIDITSLDEQRRTDWMTFESLADFLDPNDRTKTIEGYPAPRRAVYIAKSPK